MTDTTAEHEIKGCCANFYQSDLARMLLGSIFRPGGLDFTRHLGERISLGPADHVLDVACGRGASAVHLAEKFGCRVTGLDYGDINVSAATAHAAQSGMAHLTTFRLGDAEGLPFGDGTFDAAVSECSFCTFPDKPMAAAEMARVLTSGGRLGLADMTVNRKLPGDVQSLLAWVACMAGAGTTQQYVTILQASGFTAFTLEDHQNALLNMVTDVRRKQLGVELAVALGKLNLGSLDLEESKRLARRAVELIEDGTVGYTLITARKE